MVVGAPFRRGQVYTAVYMDSVRFTTRRVRNFDAPPGFFPRKTHAGSGAARVAQKVL